MDRNVADVPVATLMRLLSPRSIAVVGASERRPMSNVAIANLQGAPVDLHLVNPSASEAYGRPTVASLTDIDGPVDAVMSLVGAERTLAVVEEAGQVGAAGVVVVASGFAEVGAEGVALQERLAAVAHAARMAIVGPNCTGFANLTAGISLFTGTAVDVRAGGISIVSSSGYLMRSAMVAARERNLGIRIAVSAGNEAVTTLADYMDAFIADPETSVICAIVEKLREPEAFFELAAQARAAGKPVVVLKLGRTERARDIVKSHTGAITSEGWLYDVAFRSAGVLAAESIDDLLDLAAVVAQLPVAKVGPVERVAILTSSGGAAALAIDTVDDDDVKLPALTSLIEPLRAFIPGVAVANPLDLTGFTMSDPEAMVSVLQLLVDSAEVDAVVVTWWIGDDDEQRSKLLLDPIARVAGTKPIVMTTLESSRIGRWTENVDIPMVAFCRGIGGAARALRATRTTSAPASVAVVPSVPPLPRPAELVATDVGLIVPFEQSMRLLADAGVPVATWWLFDSDTWPTAGGKDRDARFVVKLADVAHRTELGAVRLGVADADVPAAAAELVAIAKREGVSSKVAVQAQASGLGEAFIGTQNGTEVGDVIVVGLGGILVELTRKVVGRRLPLAGADIDGMLDEFGGDTVFRGIRGGEPWDRAGVARAVGGAAVLSQRAASWLHSMDINPLICNAEGCVAVDALMIVRDQGV
jgi:acyl-CoA synthetase (NDP forming)